MGGGGQWNVPPTALRGAELALVGRRARIEREQEWSYPGLLVSYPSNGEETLCPVRR